jgi:hypothetical protein
MTESKSNAFDVISADINTAMRRGHWRRAAPGWTDQRVGWSNPFWKGPDMTAVTERAYHLKP